MLTMSTNLVSSAIKHTEVDLSQVLHGEQYLEILDELPTEGELVTNGSVIDVTDKRSGAVVVANCKVFLIVFSLFDSLINMNDFRYRRLL